MSIEIVGPDHASYAKLQEFMGEVISNNRFDYDDFCMSYNEAPIDFILAFEYSGSTMSNFVTILNQRGLIRKFDYEFKTTQAKTEKRGVHRVVLKKLTDTKMKLGRKSQEKSA